jgi:hypothetical protein
MATTPKTGSAYTYSADPSRPANPALADLSPDAEVTVAGADKDQVRLSWRDASGMPREASVPADEFGGSFTKKA